MRTESLRRLGFNERTNSYIPSFRYYRRPRVPEATVFSVPVEKIKQEVSEFIRGMQRRDRLNPFSRQTPDKE